MEDILPIINSLIFISKILATIMGLLTYTLTTSQIDEYTICILGLIYATELTISLFPVVLSKCSDSKHIFNLSFFVCCAATIFDLIMGGVIHRFPEYSYHHFVSIILYTLIGFFAINLLGHICLIVVYIKHSLGS